MTMQINPFFEVYVGDRLTSSEFVGIFSPFLVEHAQALFLPGNVVVKGIQGSGKSMLLTLLKADVRREYGRAMAQFPVQGATGDFIGAGINLAHCNAMDFGYRRLTDDPEENALLFADFVNHQILLDLFDSLRKLANPDRTIKHYPTVSLDPARTNDFTKHIRDHPVFQGSLSGCQTIEEVEARMRHRINAYVRYLHRNDRQLDEGIRTTKTDMGTPISTIVAELKRAGIITEKVPVFIHVDQYEELANISAPDQRTPDYRAVINRALARRDSAISYRIGTRGHAWRNHGRILGSTARLEEERDYKFVDLDLLLKRSENPKTYIFPRFVADVFARRLRHVGLASDDAQGDKLLSSIFGDGIAPQEKARRYGGRNPGRAVKVDPDWPEPFSAALREMVDRDPLDARLLEARALQRIDRTAPRATRLLPAELTMDIRDDVEREWWRKERVELALVQIAGRCQERPIWSGKSEVIELSGGNILTFLNICQNIWDTNTQLGRRSRDTGLTRIDDDLQAIGILKASEYWLRKILRETGRSGDRSRFVQLLGTFLARRLHADRQMSNPGHNGFSVPDDELAAPAFVFVQDLLWEMVDYGSLVASSHITKEKDRLPRTKFYLNPVLCPHFRIHYKRLKEPIYVHAAEVASWMAEAKLPVPEGIRRSRPNSDPAPPLPLFED